MRVVLLLLLALLLPAAVSAAGDAPDLVTMRSWIEAMKLSPRGPFERIRWFCADGSILPPTPYACRERGGGVQHGEWTLRTIELRRQGYEIATVFADLDGERFTGPNADLEGLEQILIERFLIGIDDGWIFRGARWYRGAFQSEDEEAGARRVLLQILADPKWLQPERYTLLREAVRLLPLQRDQATSSNVRNLATQIARRDHGFESLRARIHSMPEAGDAKRVREHAKKQSDPTLAPMYEVLANSIDQLYAATKAADETMRVLDALPATALVKDLKALAVALQGATEPAARFALAAQLLEGLRENLDDAKTPAARLDLLRASLALEEEAYAAGNTALAQLRDGTRDDHLLWLDRTAASTYGIGFIGARELSAIRTSIRRLRTAERLVLDDYRDELRYLARVPEWAQAWLRFRFGPMMDKMSGIEPLAHRYARDRLRGSPLIVYGAALDTLLLDANAVAGVQHELFGKKVGTGLRALNPGLSRGILSAADLQQAHPHFEPNDIYLLPETTPDLPPVAGILTEGEGSSLSHVQLLARNLGIPNLVVGYDLLATVRSHVGQRVVLAVSPNGVAQLVRDGKKWDVIFGAEEASDSVALDADLGKLDLEKTRIVPLAELRASDSGCVSGPKGAKLGELKHAFGDAVPDGFVIPFGVFRELLDRPIAPGGPPAWEWMRARYTAIAKLEADKTEQRNVVRAFLAQLQSFIMNVELDPAFVKELTAALESTFGADGSYGVFVRSDTNVEDLPGFTGAGLNLTVPNVVGTEKIFAALRRVWASPFTERAYAWRQARMQSPEYVFPAVLIQYSFPAEKSGVLVTADLETQKPGYLTVAVNEGVGGAVEGQAAESLLIRADDGAVKFLSRATAPYRSVLAPKGGIAREPASGTESVLTQAEIRQLLELAAEVPARFPSLRDATGAPAPADIEFAFRNNRLALLQIRPLVENRDAKRSRYLSSLDAAMRERANQPVDLKAAPKDDTGS
jgi:hypothetical protein